MGVVITPVYGFEAPDDDEPLFNLGGIFRRSAARMEEVAQSKGLAAVNASDLAALAARVRPATATASAFTRTQVLPGHVDNYVNLGAPTTTAGSWVNVTGNNAGMTWNTTTGVFTIPTTGLWMIMAQVDSDSTNPRLSGARLTVSGLAAARGLGGNVLTDTRQTGQPGWAGSGGVNHPISCGPVVLPSGTTVALAARNNTNPLVNVTYTASIGFQRLG